MMILKILGGDNCYGQNLGCADGRSYIIGVTMRFQQIINHAISGYNVGVVHVSPPL